MKTIIILTCMMWISYIDSNTQELEQKALQSQNFNVSESDKQKVRKEYEEKMIYFDNLNK